MIHNFNPNPRILKKFVIFGFFEAQCRWLGREVPEQYMMYGFTVLRVENTHPAEVVSPIDHSCMWGGSTDCKCLRVQSAKIK